MAEDTSNTAAVAPFNEPARGGSPEPLDSNDSAPTGDNLVEADLLVEDVSIDGMCGVY